MSDINNFKNLKKARVYQDHLQDILKIVNLSIQGLKLFEVYESVRNILTVLRQEKKILEGQLNLQKEVISKKGIK